jgi:DNA-binding transcriptional regulator PaaX
MDNKYKHNKEVISKEFQEIIEDFLHSNTASATVTKFLLAFIALGGVAFIGALAPGIFLAAKSMQGSRRYSKKQISGAIHTLKSRKLIEIIEEGNNKFKVQLTNKGKKSVKEFCFEALTILTPEKWDKKWRVLIFDIPTKPKIYHQAREALRHKIKELGFYQMQKSTWVFPYECEDEILFIAELFQVQKHIEILTVEKLLHENKLKKKFNL